MLFNSYIFILFMLPVTVIMYYAIYAVLGKYTRKKVTQFIGLGWLLAMSLWFYGYFNPFYLVLIVNSILVNYILTVGMNRVREKAFGSQMLKALFGLGLIFNLGLLFYFKYYNFFVDNMNVVFHQDWALKQILLPLGISFFTFQQVSYVIDCYKRPYQYGFIEYATFVCFFPQLVAGPIVLHSELIPQLIDMEQKKVKYHNLSKGLYSFAMGLGKKVLLADTFSKIVNVGMNDLTNVNGISAWVIMICYTLQIYFDFSGYCDMARGIGWLFNMELPDNFDSPYKAKSVAEFWTRWHMTLTRFFTTYLYIPLGGNRRGKLRTYCNTFFVFVVSGLWHGANWTFVLWGALHGLVLTIEKIWKDITHVVSNKNKVGRKLIKLLVQFKGIYAIFTFLFVNMAWVLFRAESIEKGILFLRKLWQPFEFQIMNVLLDTVNELTEVRLLCRLGLQGLEDRYPWLPLCILMGVTLGFVFFAKNTREKMEQQNYTWVRSVLTIGVLILSIISLSDVSEFLYFNF